MRSDLVQLAGEFAPRLLPFVACQRRRHGIAVEDGENHRDERIENDATVVGSVRAQYALDHLAHHRKAERIGLPARPLEGFNEPGIPQQYLGVMTGTGLRIIVEALLHDEGGLLVDEIGELPGVTDGRPATEKSKEIQTILLILR